MPQKQGKGHRIVARQLFPIKTILALWEIQQACDFIGKESSGPSWPVSMLSTSGYPWFEIHQIWRVLSAIVEEAVLCLERFRIGHP